MIHVRNTLYDTLPFYQKETLWNLYGPGALIKRALGLPAPSINFYSRGTPIEAMGAAQLTAASQYTVENKVREMAHELEKSPPGYRPAIGYQAGRLRSPGSTEYGAPENKYPKGTTILPGNKKRFDKEYERRAPGFSKVDVIETPEDIMAFDAAEQAEAYTRRSKSAAKAA